MAGATNNFSDSARIGQVVAIKRAQEGSLQGEKEFLTEIELLSRLHHRNLVSLIGYCDEKGEQVHVRNQKLCVTESNFLFPILPHWQLLNLNLSGTLAPEIGNLSYLEIVDFMWNDITGSIPKEIGNIKTLKLLLLSENKLTNDLPDELGHLPALERMQIDENIITGSIPLSFANLNSKKHFHMNNNSLSGQIPAQLSQLGSLIHLLLDINNLTGNLPSELSEMPSLTILYD
ncbi:probable LRR receptor-like serine/threonine-protein kinase At1g06840 [Vigna unguiculata]|uniref:probable LRR receptor-like serine/threonine-protein kinase At1g06840 n=1 Tax=Vigna unguiculata TaxID=3917 RepID=UPI0010160C94|nr:probable LRR receptor-like serine/threonine-protein kinase At1g06840 [Vigna unguiculata]